MNLYQIQTKFRDEIRPRFGVMRAREFTMKDAYSFDADYAGLEKSYKLMFDAYTRIFTRLGLKFRAVAADTGEIGGTGSHEFQVLAAAGEDAIAFCPDSDYAANVELAEAIAPGPRAPATQAMQKVATPGKHTCEEVSEFLKIPIEKTVKSIVVMRGREAPGRGREAPGGVEQPEQPEQPDEMFMLLVRGDHMLNEIKTTKVPGLRPFRFATAAEIQAKLQASPGSLGPMGKDVKIIADRTVAAMSDWCCGANEDGFHYKHVNFRRDFQTPHCGDFAKAQAGYLAPDGNEWATARIAPGSLAKGMTMPPSNSSTRYRPFCAARLISPGSRPARDNPIPAKAMVPTITPTTASGHVGELGGLGDRRGKQLQGQDEGAGYRTRRQGRDLVSVPLRGMVPGRRSARQLPEGYRSGRAGRERQRSHHLRLRSGDRHARTQGHPLSGQSGLKEQRSWHV